ncbi:helix-turn-helix domain-containing protein [Halorubrum amylolyticum]|uniref:helix-turn-helix domain-containing protein n=1 Tax=Halorubrum amylolyticum TaxID=2508724 RepID=UPI001008D6BC
MIPITNSFDLIVLRCLSKSESSNASEIAERFDRSRPYVRTRLITLAETGYVRTIGVNPRFQAYELTPMGAAVVRRVNAVVDS